MDDITPSPTTQGPFTLVSEDTKDAIIAHAADLKLTDSTEAIALMAKHFATGGDMHSLGQFLIDHQNTAGSSLNA
jgi:hypothetical protein